MFNRQRSALKDKRYDKAHKSRYTHGIECERCENSSCNPCSVPPVVYKEHRHQIRVSVEGFFHNDIAGEPYGRGDSACGSSSCASGEEENPYHNGCGGDNRQQSQGVFNRQTYFEQSSGGHGEERVTSGDEFAVCGSYRRK